MLKLNPICQRDGRWRDVKLGGSDLTVGGWGCTTAAGCMAAQAFGKDVTPDRIAVRENVYQIDGNLKWIPFSGALGVDFGFRMDTTANQSGSHANFSEGDVRIHVDRLIEWGMPSLCLVDTNRDGKPNHWVTYVGDGFCIDPWDGETKRLGSFGRLYGVAILNGTPVLAGGKVGAMIGKANEVHRGRNVALNVEEIMNVINRP